MRLLSPPSAMAQSLACTPSLVFWHPFRMRCFHDDAFRWSFRGKRRNDHRLPSVNPSGLWADEEERWERLKRLGSQFGEVAWDN